MKGKVLGGSHDRVGGLKAPCIGTDRIILYGGGGGRGVGRTGA